MTRLLDIGVSSLVAHQTALATTGHNIANAGVEGYSRQEAVFGAREPQFNGAGFLGSGVGVETIRRIADRFVVQQVLTDTTRALELSVLSEGLNQLDQLLADENTGLSGVLNSMFASLQAASESPTSIPLRQQVLAEAERLVERYDRIQNQFESLAGLSNDVLTGVTAEINAIAKGIAEVNGRLQEAKKFSQTDSVNDLLDRRDSLLKSLAEKVSFSTVAQDGDGVNVFIAGGQALVLGVNTNELIVLESEASGFDVDLAIDVNGAVRRISGQITGGQLGGNLKFREQGLGDIADQLGLVQTLVVHNLNTLHKQGVDLSGVAGGDLFTSLNDREAQLSRVIYAPTNSADDAVMSVQIDDPSALQPSSYEFQLSGFGLFNYTITRSSDGTVVSEGILPDEIPQQIKIDDGFTINMESGNFGSGDVFTLTPTRLSSEHNRLLVSDPASLAFALPISAEPLLGNRGTASISQSSAAGAGALSTADLAAAASARANTPPLLIRFTSASTFDVLDNSDPLAPVALAPPLTNLSYIPGQINPILTQGADTQILASSGAFSQIPNVGANGTTNNGNPGEAVTFTIVDPVTGATNNQVVSILAGESAATAALRLRSVQGVNAQANNTMTVSVSDDGIGSPLQLSLNGVDITSTAQGPVPQPVTADFLAERVNNLLGAAGVVASVQSGNLVVRSLRGDDFVLSNTGAGADTVTVAQANGAASAAIIGAGNEATLAGSLNVQLEENVAVGSTGGFLGTSSATNYPAFVGYDVEISGVPQAGDRFTINLGNSGAGDNRNALAMALLQTAPVLGKGNASISDVYSSMVGVIGSKASSARIDAEAAISLKQQSDNRLSSVSGVNLDEEAARLLQYEQAYNAAAQIISIARSTFDTLIGAFR